MANENTVGEAYGFFYCSASKPEIEAEFPEIRKRVDTPSQLELSLIEGMDKVRGDNELIDLAQEAKSIGMNYMLHLRYPYGTNQDTADVAERILNQTYMSTLYQEGARFRASIVYKEKGEYVFRNLIPSHEESKD